MPSIHPFKWQLFTVSKKLCITDLGNKVVILLASVSNLGLLSSPEQTPLLRSALYSSDNLKATLLIIWRCHLLLISPPPSYMDAVPMLLAV